MWALIRGNLVHFPRVPPQLFFPAEGGRAQFAIKVLDVEMSLLMAFAVFLAVESFLTNLAVKVLNL